MNKKYQNSYCITKVKKVKKNGQRRNTENEMLRQNDI